MTPGRSRAGHSPRGAATKERSMTLAEYISQQTRPVQFKTAQYLAGSKRAVLTGGVVYLSPAMYQLLTTADDSDERGRIVEAIELVNMDGTNYPVSLQHSTVEDVMREQLRRLGQKSSWED